MSERRFDREGPDGERRRDRKGQSSGGREERPYMPSPPRDEGLHRPPEDDRPRRGGRRLEEPYTSRRRSKEPEVDPSIALHFGPAQRQGAPPPKPPRERRRPPEDLEAEPPRRRRPPEDVEAVEPPRRRRPPEDIDIALPRRGGGGQRQAKQNNRGPLRGIICALLIIAVLIVGGLAWWNSFAKKPNVDPPTGDQTQEDHVRDPDAPTRLSGDRKEDFYTFLIVGRDTIGGGNTDTIMLASYDVPNQNLSLMSIPRDTMVNVSWDVKKINSIYNQYNDKEKAIQALDAEVAELVGFVPDFQIIVEWKAVWELVDAIGGVTFHVPQDMNKITEDVIINLKEGQQRIGGYEAMQLVRYRDYPNGDLGRVQVQQDFMKVVLEECLSISNITRINQLVKVFNDNVKTNLKVGEIAWFAQKAVFGGLKSDKLHLTTMPCIETFAWSSYYKQNLSYVVPKADEVVALVNQRFNPYVKPLEKNELDIMYVNEDGSVGSTTGVLADKNANKR